MSHSHLAIRHLVRKLEKSPQRRPVKQNLPNWLAELIDELSSRFEPFNGVARVGYECQQSESGWELALFLGEHETVGGAEDGELRPINFRFDVLDLTRHFDAVASLRWNAFPSSHVCFESMADLSFLTLEGTIQGQLVRLQVHAGPPDSVGPAIREHQDGRVELV